VIGPSVRVGRRCLPQMPERHPHTKMTTYFHKALGNSSVYVTANRVKKRWMHTNFFVPNLLTISNPPKCMKSDGTYNSK
jgi:hypothetical protein